MAEGRRPGGLTALAVINFIFGGFGALGFLALIAVFAILGAAGGEEADEAQREMAKAWEDMGMGLFYFVMAVSLVSTILLIASGVGYLKQKQFLGRKLGNSYALLAILNALVMASQVTEEAGGGFALGNLIGLIYPLLTLYFLNVTFKEDFVNP